MEKRITNRQNFNEIIELATASGRQDLVDFCNAQIALIDKRNAARAAKPNKRQVENEATANQIMDFLFGKGQVAVKDIRDAFSLSPQKASPILSDLVEEGKLVREDIKRVIYYKVVE